MGQSFYMLRLRSHIKRLREVKRNYPYSSHQKRSHRFFIFRQGENDEKEKANYKTLLRELRAK